MDLTRVLQLEVRGFLILLAVTLVWKMLTRQIPLDGLLADKNDSRQVSAERVQLLVSTLAVSGAYIVQTMHGTSGTMPNISPQWLYLMGGSSSIYAGVKAFKFFNSRATTGRN